jgi:hypothetical protein
MNIARLLKADERSYPFKSVTGISAAWQVAKSRRSESTFLHRQSPAVSAPPQIQNRARKSPTHDLLWIDMITNALIVIAIASASYFFIAAKGLRANIDPAVTSYSERSEPR